MPKPVYIICSESGAVDRYTNSMSIYNIIEKVSFLDEEALRRLKQNRAKIHVQAIATLRITACWAQESRDGEHEFEFQNTIQPPDSDSEIVVGQGEIVFRTPLHRVVSDIVGPPFDKEGIVSVKSKIRRAADADWIVQEYLIRVEKPLIAVPETAGQN